MKHRYIDTELETTFGVFTIRVYAEAFGKETIVLRTKSFNPDEAVLVRVHSECITGDTLGSLRCDCGEQLNRSLKQIADNGNGALVYLRQEGRGIGLFEKMQSYELQRKGYDTFEANVILGHKPDERNYAWAKIALNDLGVKQIKLITNNPSKVSELAKLGFEVVERIPIVIKSNEFNQKYFDAKRDKFKHFFNKEVSYYFYQFHAESVEHVQEIGEFLRDNKRDPLLKICVGVSADSTIFQDTERIEQIQAIFQACEYYENFVPILHFSFSKSSDPEVDVKEIKKKLSFVSYLQLNDLDASEMSTLAYACKNFLADVPLFDENFHLVDYEGFRDLIKKHKAFVLLDNSKGKGVRDSKENLMKKIDILINHGINDIAIFGGFGPDDLDTYFELRRHYKINFSIDAETKLKTDGKIDIEKTKTYLKQLLRFDDPKEAGVEQSRIFLQQNQLTDWNTVEVDGLKFKVHPAVFNPGPFPSTKWFSDFLNEYVVGQKDFCEVGCGAGVISCLAAKANSGLKVMATDINPFAVETTKLNVVENDLQNQIEVVEGDVLDGVGKDSKFDTMFWALPFGYLDPGTKIDLRETQLFDPGYRATRKFLREARQYLKPDGAILLGFSEDLGNMDLLEDIAKECGVKFEKLAEMELKESELIHFEIIRGTYTN